MAQKKNSCGQTAMGCLLMIGLFIGGMYWLLKPDTPEQAVAKQAKAQEQQARDEQERKESEAKWAAEEVKQPDRKAMMDRLVRESVFTKIELREGGATAWVDATFYLLPFDDKATFCAPIHGYICVAARSEHLTVTLKDARSGKTAGSYDLYGLNME